LKDGRREKGCLARYEGLIHVKERKGIDNESLCFGWSLPFGPLSLHFWDYTHHFLNLLIIFPSLLLSINIFGKS